MISKSVSILLKFIFNIYINYCFYNERNFFDVLYLQIETKSLKKIIFQLKFSMIL